MIFLFDIDGTLIRTDHVGRRAFERACDEHLGHTGTLESIRLDGKTDPGILDEVFLQWQGRDATAEEHEAILGKYLDYLAEALPSAQYEVLPGVVEVLDELDRRGAPLGLATGNHVRGAEIKLSRGDLWRRFRFGGFGSDAKERSELVRVGVQRGRAHARDVEARRAIWVIGDTPRDIHAAHAAGARALGVATGSFDEAALREAGADRTVPDLRSFWSVFEDAEDRLQDA